MVVGWLTKLTVTLAVLGVLLFDVSALLVGRVQVADHATPDSTSPEGSESSAAAGASPIPTSAPSGASGAAGDDGAAGSRASGGSSADAAVGRRRSQNAENAASNVGASSRRETSAQESVQYTVSREPKPIASRPRTAV